MTDPSVVALKLSFRNSWEDGGEVVLLIAPKLFGTAAVECALWQEVSPRLATSFVRPIVRLMMYTVPRILQQRCNLRFTSSDLAFYLIRYCVARVKLRFHHILRSRHGLRVYPPFP